MKRGPLATQASKMLINAAEGEEVHRPLEALAGGLASASEELKTGGRRLPRKAQPGVLMRRGPAHTQTACA